MASQGQKGSTCSVIIVTHNSQAYLPACLDALRKQTCLPDQVIIVDSGSTESDYVAACSQDSYMQISLQKENVGFCKGNNIGFSYVPLHTDYVLFLNPDAFLGPTFIEQAKAYMELPQSAHMGALSGLLLGYDVKQNKPTGLLDSSGIFRTWYGRWYDRGQGQEAGCQPVHPEAVPALCGALMFCRYRALQDVCLEPFQVMDPTFYMYKEDIDLSLRLRRKGWELWMLPHLWAYHCRGWQRDRSKVDKRLRLLSAKNEMRLYARFKSPCYFYSALKYLSVKAFDL
ncbi:glycosyltransferase family 2 protein [Candidatus Protochlamydia phocaeensis]|uniref:glycosyltransferase family 2 protein n=1 Tax=Candidatus Protochlamydia phocaeensis TaxID=1414722 RepID=UPI0008395BA0|nr:glycosyltransferase family 2 protein [Candidatus Protochlamydia phocaeensis]